MRRRLIPLFLLIAILYSCKKDHFNQEEIRLLKTKVVDSSGTAYYTTFEYDQAGRITTVSGATNNNTPQVKLSISYSGNVATISDVLTSEPGLYANTIITYQLNNDYQPILRILYDTLSLSPPLSTESQRNATKDTARYEYDAAGLLKKVTGSRYDSIWYNPGIAEITTDRRTYTRDYSNSSGMLTGITTHMQDLYNFRSLSNQYTRSYTTEATHTFEYTHHESNKTDFVNAWLFAELYILYGLEYPLNKFYSQYPEKITWSEVTRDASNGQFVRSSNETRTIMVNHTKFGFISSYSDGSRPENKVELIYNR